MVGKIPNSPKRDFLEAPLDNDAPFPGEYQS
jgi:hypothetical protein